MSKPLLQAGFRREFEDRGEAYRFVAANDKNIDDDCEIGVEFALTPDGKAVVAVDLKAPAKRRGRDKVLFNCLTGADKNPYKSPITGAFIDSNHKRREEMKREGVREVDNTEFKPCYRNPEFRKKHGISEDRGADPLPRAERRDYDAPPPGMERLLRR